SVESMAAPFSIRLSHHTDASTITDGILRVAVAYHFQSYDSSSPPSLHFSIECVFDAEYLIEDTSYQPSEESISAFKDGNAIFNTWPYAREFVQNTAARMSVQPPPIPFLRIITKPSPTKTKQPVNVPQPTVSTEPIPAKED
ncbi:MAG: hypothetical protein ABSF12_26365, partial [Bryobacteraceae bacterium]